MVPDYTWFQGLFDDVRFVSKFLAGFFSDAFIFSACLSATCLSSFLLLGKPSDRFSSFLGLAST